MKKGKGIKSALKSTGSFIKKHKNKIAIALATAAVLAGTKEAHDKIVNHPAYQHKGKIAAVAGTAYLASKIPSTKAEKITSKSHDEDEFGDYFGDYKKPEKEWNWKRPKLIYEEPTPLYQDLPISSLQKSINSYNTTPIVNSYQPVGYIGSGLKFNRYKVRKNRY